MMLQMALVCFRATLTHFVVSKNHKKQWKIGFRRTLSHIMHVWIWCLRWLWSALGQHSHSLWLSKKDMNQWKVCFRRTLSDILCVSIWCFRFSEGNGMWYVSSAMGCFFISSIAMRCIGIQQGRYLEILSIMKMHGVRMYISHWDNWAIEVIACVFLCCTY